MENLATTTVRDQRGSLIDAIVNVHTEFAQLKGELDAAHREIARLRRKLSKRDRRGVVVPDVDLPSLRRHVAFYCHPDRSGDGALMQKLNVLFDYLEYSQQCQAGAR